MIEDIPTFSADKQIFRFANPPNKRKTLKNFGLDNQSTLESEFFFGLIDKDDVLDSLLEAPFLPKPQLEAKLTLGNSRFSDGNWRVGYFALELETAQQEIAHHAKNRILENKGEPKHYFYFKCRYQGDTKDLRAKLSDWPQLIQENYQFCQKLGREAININLSGFFAPSARKLDGTSVPVFKRNALSKGDEGKVLGRKQFSLDSQSNQIDISNISLD